VHVIRHDDTRLEVSLLVRNSDLSRAINAQSQANDSRPDLAATDPTARARADQQIAALLKRAFIVREQGGRRLPLVWVGREPQSTSTQWLHFVFSSKQPASSLFLSNRLLMDIEPDQINTVTVFHPATTHTIRLTADSDEVNLATGRTAAWRRDE
jgi:hypothetical protein